MPLRRKSDPTNVQCIWDAIKYLIWQKLPPEPQRITKQLIKLNGFSAKEWEKCIKEVLADSLIEFALKRDAKIAVYKMPSADMLILDGRDWYCFECHGAGDVAFCKNKSCYRVYHPECVTKSAISNYRLFKNLFSNSDSTVFLKKGLPNRRKSLCLETDGIEMVDSGNFGIRRIYDNSLCIACNIVTLENFTLDKSELNYLFRFVLQRIRSWLPENITHKMEGLKASPKWQTSADLALRAKHLFFEYIDMSVMEVKINNESYSNCHSFLSDVLTVNHNIGIFHGVESQEYEATKFILRDTLHDLGEIIGCIDCYKNSNEKINTNWFSLPCRTAHEIVWAKQKGYCYWPAKVVKESDTHYDVRFFGGKHERALLTKQFVQPISKSKESLQVRNSAALLKALEELELHQNLSQNPSALEAFIATSKKKNSNLKQERSPMKGTKKTKCSKSPMISNDVEYKRPTKRKKEKSKKGDVILTELPDKPLKKRGRLSMPMKKDLESPEVGTKIPFQTWRGNPPKKDRDSPEIGTAVEDIPQKKKRRRPSKNGAGVRRTRSTAVKPKNYEEVTDKHVENEEVINISDGEDMYTFSGNLTRSAMTYGDCEEQLEQVTSSTEVKGLENSSQSREMQQLDHPFSDEVEMMRRTLEGLCDKKEIIKFSMNCMQKEIDRITEKHNDHLKKLFESHNNQISETKRKQWCFYCEQDAIYHCCWNTAYCSTTCQQQHWLVEHKKVCRRKK